MAAVKAVQRETYKTFWDKYSDKPSNEAMLLNKNADELEELDRADILASLPDFTDKDVVDIGAGIGRFTTIFSQTARHVTSTDFIESFIAKNKERNAAAKNIKYVVSDAAHLHLSPSSVDLVFTNWLMMYMADSEVVEFITGALKWLRPGGNLKLRESCSEPSTGRKKTSTMHTNDVNPTHYRYSSLYIQLLKHAQIQDADGAWWKFDLKWSASVPTYIERLSNWRQVHWLAEKVPADPNERHLTFDELVHVFATEWVNEQKSIDALLDGESTSWCQSIMRTRVQHPNDATVLGYNPRKLDPFVHVDSFEIAKTFNANLWTIETDPFYYRTSLTKATETKDHRVRFGWNNTFTEALDYLISNKAEFTTFVATELMSTTTESDLKTLKEVLIPEATVSLLEPMKCATATETYLKRLEKAGFQVQEVANVTSEVSKAINTYAEERKLEKSLFEKSLEQEWVFISVTIA